jgi:hypothetical protein
MRGRIDMASSNKQKTTMAKRNRENRLRERRELKRAKKDARKLAAQTADPPTEGVDEQVLAPGAPPGPDG